MNKFNQLGREEMRKVMGGSPGNGSYTGCEGQTRFECEMYVFDQMGDDVPYGLAESLANSICSQCAETRPV